MLQYPRSLLTLTTLACLSTFSPSRVSNAKEPEKAQQDHDRLMNQAEASRRSGDHVAAARLYSEAYLARPKRHRADLIGEIVVRNAIIEFQIALDREPTDLEQHQAHLELLRAEQTLLHDFISARQRDGVPQDIARAAVELVPKINRTERDIQLLVDQERDRVAKERAWRKHIEDSETERPIWNKDHSEANRRAKVNASLLGTGITLFVGGSALIATAAWMYAVTTSRGNRYSRAAVAEHMAAELSERTQDQIDVDDQEYDDFHDELASFRRRSRINATLFVVSGGVLAGTGIGLFTASIVRMRRSRKNRRSHNIEIAPQVRRDGFEFAASVAF